MLTRFHSQTLLTIRRVGGGGRESLASPRAETVYLLLTEQLVHVSSEQEGTCELLGHKVSIQFCLCDEKVQFPLLSSCLKREREFHKKYQHTHSSGGSLYSRVVRFSCVMKLWNTLNSYNGGNQWQ